MKTISFDAFKTPLNCGVNLIEASAGTGKTYTLAMLVLRFIVEKNLPLEKILVVTFTKAATEELRERIRLRLFEAKQALKSANAPLSDWLNSLSIDSDEIERRLQIALLSIDQASIFTIHSFCQKVLREHALESGQLFNAQLTDDLAQITQICADDFWRKQIYPRSSNDAAVLTIDYQTPDELLESVDKIGYHVKIYPTESKNLDELLYELNLLKITACEEFNRCREKFESLLDNFNTGADKKFFAISKWLNNETAQIDKNTLEFLTSEGILKALNKRKVTAKNQPIFLTQLNLDFEIFNTLARLFSECGLMLRWHLLNTLRREIDQRLLQRNALTFDYLIIRLDEALRGENKSEQLILQLRERFSVALIDEFQDTDSSQWFIFKTLFAAQSQFLYLIGDPKQAIYKFRGADIYSYLNAKHNANTSFTLKQNWRSHPKLVQAVNQLFVRENAFLIEELEFNPVEAAQLPENGEIYFENAPLPPFVFWHLLPEENKEFWSSNKGTNKTVEEQLRFAVIEEILRLLKDDFTLVKSGEKQTLKPKNIAILVRKNKEAKAFQNALREVGVPSVLNSTESVFSTPQANQLHTLLNAIVHPTDIDAVKHALTLDWFASIPDGQAFYKIVGDENALDVWLTKFLNYYEQWQKLGLMAMMHTFLATENVTSQLAKTSLAERELTNIHHLLELLQEATLDEHLSPQKTLEWLRLSITNALTQKVDSTENQQLRLESDEDAVTIVTMHRSKGLEYDVVFCPSLWRPTELWEKDRAACHIDGEMCVDLGGEDFEKHRVLALEEQRAEDCRMFYVALTRAKYRCYLMWANVRTKENVNNSAMAHLLDFAMGDSAFQENCFLDFTRLLPDCFAYQPLFELQKPQENYQPEIKTEKLVSLDSTRNLRFSSWQMSSYTALSAFSKQIVADLPEDKAQEPLEFAQAIKLDLPRGTHTGNVIHELLENFSFADLANKTDISIAREKACLRYSLKIEQPEIIDNLLQNVVQTPLSEDINFCLKNLLPSHCLKEMPFYLATRKINTAEINRILSDEPSYKLLDNKTIQGYLTGFIDLICEYENRFYVMDYKTNWLIDEDYSPEKMLEAMREHNYGLQYWLYCVVLHRYLQNRLPNYNIEKHFGGVRYLFVRGMKPDAPLSGVFETRPESQKLMAFADLF